MEEFLKTEVIASVSVYNIFVIIHLFGLALGAGAAFFSDFLFTHLMRKGKISKEEFAILTITSRVVWLGLGILIVSGVCIFLGNVERLSESAKFLAKMSIVGILTLNGLVFHFKHIPLLRRAVGKNLKTNKEFVSNSGSLFASGALSGVSWAAALVLGSLSFVDMSYAVIMIIYAIVVLLAVASSKKIQKLFLG